MGNWTFEYAFFFLVLRLGGLIGARGQHVQAIADSVSNPKSDVSVFLYIACACVFTCVSTYVCTLQV